MAYGASPRRRRRPRAVLTSAACFSVTLPGLVGGPPRGWGTVRRHSAVCHDRSVKKPARSHANDPSRQFQSASGIPCRALRRVVATPPSHLRRLHSPKIALDCEPSGPGAAPQRIKRSVTNPFRPCDRLLLHRVHHGPSLSAAAPVTPLGARPRNPN